jgi:carbon storage regulator
MLVLSRKVGEQIVVPQYKVVVTVLAIKGNVIRLGISAPDDVAVYREELLTTTPPARAKPAARKRTSDL